MADDHAAHALTCYGSELNTTPNLDRIAAAGMRFDTCFCTKSIWTPSRASVLTGTYSHVNGVTTLATLFDARQDLRERAAGRRLPDGDDRQVARGPRWHP